MSDENLIGHGACPVCGSVKARFTVSKKSLACMTCNGCNIQIFARSDNSDQRLRGFIKPASVAAAAAAETSVPAAAAVPVSAKVAKPDVEQLPIEKPKPAAPGWGFLGAFHA